MKRVSNFLFILSLFSFLLCSCSINGGGNKDDKKEVETGRLFVNKKPNKTMYYTGEALDLTGLEIINTKDNEEIITNYVTSIKEGTILNEVGIFDIEVNYKDYKSTSFSIAVNEYKEDLKLIISSYPNRNFEFGDIFNVDGLVVTNKGSIVYDYDISPLRVGDYLIQSGKQEITISKKGYISTSYFIEVGKEKALTIKKEPDVINYKTGDALDLSGLVIVDENENEIEEYITSISDGQILKYAGDIEITIHVDGYDDVSFIIHVIESGGESKYRDLKIYYLNDTHGSFIRDDKNYEAGMAYLSTYLKDKKNNNPNNTLILSGGDMFQGGFESNETKGQIMVDAMNIIGFDAMTLGNHEFDWGEDNMKNIISNLRCDVISCNTFYRDGSSLDYISPFTIIDKGDLRVGIIGGAKENMGSSITGSISDEFYFPNAINYVKDYSDTLRLNYNCDIIIASFHEGGYEGVSGYPHAYESLTEISSKTSLKYVDAMFFAHDHLVKSGVCNNVPYLESGSNGKYIGELTLSLSGISSYHVDSHNIEVNNAYSLTKNLLPDENILALNDKYKDIIGDPDEIIYNFANFYYSDDFTEIVSRSLLWFTNYYSAYFDDKHVYFASHNTGGVRSNINPGPFTKRDLIKVFPFDNDLCIQRCYSYQINNMKNNSYYRTASESTIIYDNNGLTNAVTIAYIAEYKYAYNFQTSYTKYQKTAKDALYSFLINKVETDL